MLGTPPLVPLTHTRRSSSTRLVSDRCACSGTASAGFNKSARATSPAAPAAPAESRGDMVVCCLWARSALVAPPECDMRRAISVWAEPAEARQDQSRRCSFFCGAFACDQVQARVHKLLLSSHKRIQPPCRYCCQLLRRPARHFPAKLQPGQKRRSCRHQRAANAYIRRVCGDSQRLTQGRRHCPPSRNARRGRGVALLEVAPPPSAGDNPVAVVPAPAPASASSGP